MNFIKETLQQLVEMSKQDLGLCNCGHSDSSDPADHKLYCKALKKSKGYEGITEGMTKRNLEAKVEKACNCDGGASLDPDEHEDGCPAKELLEDPGAEIDAAEYSMGDR
jgi:hypothetical protein